MKYSHYLSQIYNVLLHEKVQSLACFLRMYLFPAFSNCKMVMIMYVYLSDKQKRQPSADRLRRTCINRNVSRSVSLSE
jgi:hypothetical protein